MYRTVHGKAVIAMYILLYNAYNDDVLIKDHIFEHKNKHYLYMKVVSPWYQYSLIDTCTARFSYCYRTLLCYATPPRTEMDYCGGLILRPERVVQVY